MAAPVFAEEFIAQMAADDGGGGVWTAESTASFRGDGMLVGATAGVDAGEAPPAPLRRRFFSRLDERTKRENMATVYKTYSPAFVAYLSRILLSFDPASAEWWRGINQGVTARFDRDVQATPALVAFRDYVTSVQVGLEPFDGPKGAGRLLRLLSARYGKRRDCAWQLAVLFSLLSPELQPVDDITELLAMSPKLSPPKLIKAEDRSPAANAAAETGSSGPGSYADALKQVLGGTSLNVVRLLSPTDVEIELAFNEDGVIKPVPPPPPPPPVTVPQMINATMEASEMPTSASVAAAMAMPVPDVAMPENTFYRLILRSQGIASKVYVPPPAPFSREMENTLEAALSIDSYGGDVRRLRRDPALTKQQITRFFAAGALCSSLARLTLTPIDVVKTKVQAGASSGTGGGGVLDTARGIWEKKGSKGFFAGSDTTFAGYFIGGAAAFGLTEVLKRKIAAAVATSPLLGNGQGLGPDWAITHPVPITIGAAAIAITIATVAVMPFEAVRIRVVSSPKFAEKNLKTAAQTIYAEEGLNAFYTGLPFFLLKDVPFFVVKFVVFDKVAEALTGIFPAAREVAAVSVAVSFAAGLIAGGTAAIATHPFDSMMTLVNVKSSEAGSAKGVAPGADPAKTPFELILEEFASAGPAGTLAILSRGVETRFVFAALAVAIQFFLYDFFKISFKISSGDLTLFWDVLGGVTQGFGPPPLGGSS
mmetsp:Transcript_14564/g.43774  ORF Transcript_14564/g.43774 Transcript_14564/m.43774 type:complete len:709 (-) Transcript_14564:327-2453(-)